MKAAVALAGFTPAEADELRRAMTHRRSAERMESIRADFLEGATARGLPAPVAAAVFESLSKFSGYGFPKAHAATYGEFAYQAAYLKSHFPAEFMAAVLSNEAGFYHHSVYVEEAKRLGVAVALPDINRSEPDFFVKNGKLYFGLKRVKGVSRRTVESVLSSREEFPFTSLSDFLGRAETTEEEVSALIKCGAFDSMENTRPELLWKLSMMYPQVRSARRASPRTQRPGDGCAPTLPIPVEKVVPPRALPRLTDYTPAQKLRMELAYLEASVSRHPLEILVPDQLERAGVRSVDLETRTGEPVSLVGWVIATRRAVTKRKEYMQFITLEDPWGIFEVTLFPRDYERLGAAAGSCRVLKVTGKVDDRTGSASITATGIEPLGSIPQADNEHPGRELGR